MKRFTLKAVFGFVIFALIALSSAQAKVRTLVVPRFCDFSGPYANLMKITLPAGDAIGKWWNETEGKQLGIEIQFKNYDTRYDATVVASMWPGILAEKPVVVAGLGGPDVAALQQRLPKDKVPIIYSPAAYGFAWLPDQWIFHPRPTYAHELIAGLDFFIKQHPEKRPVRVALMSTQASIAYIDMMNGIEKYVKEVLEPKGLATIVAKEWMEIQPVDISSQYRTVMEKKADVVFGPGNSAMAAAYIRAQQLFGTSIPTIGSPHHTIWPLGAAMKTFAPWEGHYVVGAVVNSSVKEGPAYDFFKYLQKQYKLPDVIWSPFGILGLSQTMLLVRSIEHTAKRVGADNITGQAVYDTLLSSTITEKELMGILPDQHFTREAPFTLTDLKLQIGTVKNGRYQLAVPGWYPIPSDIKPW
ncbi:ABC transporter substrate-binding protein [bacterium]|nr:ABC transporter substrate-binding protein [bacterium]